MPNWCDNELWIKPNNGPRSKREYKEICDIITKSTEKTEDCMLLSAFVPMPKDLDGTTAPSEEPNWYDWCVENWGTKWDVDVNIEDMDKESAWMTFNTAWGPPVPWLKHIAKRFPKVRFQLKYQEDSMCFFGVATANQDNGKVVDEYIEWGDL